MKKYVCLICGYVHEGDEPPAVCPVCGAAADKFKEMGAAPAAAPSAPAAPAEDGRIVRDENRTGQEIRKGDTLDIPEGVKQLYKNIAGRSHPRKVIQSILTIEKRAQHSSKAV